MGNDVALTSNESSVAKDILKGAGENAQPVLDILKDAAHSTLGPRFAKITDIAAFLAKFLRTPINQIDPTINHEQLPCTSDSPAIHYLIAKGFPIGNLLAKISQAGYTLAALQDHSFNNNTPFHTAAMVGNSLAFTSLCSAHKKLGFNNIRNIKNNNNETPLHSAVEHEQTGIVKMLTGRNEDFGIDFLQENNKGQTAYQIANDLDYAQIKALLAPKEPAPAPPPEAAATSAAPENKAVHQPTVFFSLCGIGIQAKHLIYASAAIIAVAYLATALAMDDFNPLEWFANSKPSETSEANGLFTTSYQALKTSLEDGLAEQAFVPAALKI